MVVNNFLSPKYGSIFNKVGKINLFSIVCAFPNAAEILDTQAKKLDTQAQERIITYLFIYS